MNRRNRPGDGGGIERWLKWIVARLPPTGPTEGSVATSGPTRVAPEGMADRRIHTSRRRSPNVQDHFLLSVNSRHFFLDRPYFLDPLLMALFGSLPRGPTFHLSIHGTVKDQRLKKQRAIAKETVIQPVENGTDERTTDLGFGDRSVRRVVPFRPFENVTDRNRLVAVQYVILHPSLLEIQTMK
jgi:hypothetical protein